MIKYPGAHKHKPAKNKSALAAGDKAAASFQQGLAHHQLGDLTQAAACYRQALQAQPRHFDSLHMLGVVHYQQHQFESSVSCIKKAIGIHPGFGAAYSNLGNALLALGQQDEALANYERAIAINPELSDAHFNRGNVLLEQQQHEQALKSYERALAINPNYYQVHNNRGNALKRLNRKQDALDSYNRAIELNADYAETYNNRGAVLNDLGFERQAMADYERAIALKPDHVDALVNLAMACADQNQPEKALQHLDRAMSLQPDNADVLNTRGIVLQDLKRVDEALIMHDRAIAIRPDFAEAHINRGSALRVSRRYAEALHSCDQAILLKPDAPEAYINKGNVLRDLNRGAEALVSFDQAIALNPAQAQAFHNRGNTLQDLRRSEEALASFDQAIALKPHHAEAFHNRGHVLIDLKQHQKALASFEQAHQLKPDYEFLKSTKLNVQLAMCDWRMLDFQSQQIKSAVHSGQKAARPFHVLAWSDDPALQLRTAQTYCEALYPASDELGPIRSHYGHAKLKIGYYSADFHNHATSVLMAELFESHDASKFEIYGFSFGPNVDDDMRKRVAGAFTQFVDVSRLSDAEVAQLSRELEIDIAIDLKGYTHDCRTGIFSYRCAPIQVNYLGYPGTMGAPYIDYILADHTLIPPELERHYSEKVIRLPHSYQVNDSKRKISDRVFTRRELGLPDEGFVFCCFNNNYKIMPDTFDSWMRLLGAVDGSVLWLLADNPIVVERLREEARLRGVNPDRLVFAPRMPLEEHLARHRLADLFIDTFPCNAHTTASDALWAGLPVLTLMGLSFASRVAASLLNALDMPELIVESTQDYERTALELALNPERLAQVKAKLEIARIESPLFKGDSFAKHLEAAFEDMHRQHLLSL